MTEPAMEKPQAPVAPVVLPPSGVASPEAAMGEDAVTTSGSGTPARAGRLPEGARVALIATAIGVGFLTFFLGVIGIVEKVQHENGAGMAAELFQEENIRVSPDVLGDISTNRRSLIVSGVDVTTGESKECVVTSDGSSGVNAVCQTIE